MSSSRYLYHSFPRRHSGSRSPLEPKGERILRLITEYGLLMTPEVVTWVERSRNTWKRRVLRTLQQRVCLTELSPSELPAHSRVFGKYALEFALPVGRLLGAMPVFYVSTIDPPKGFEAMGASTVFRIDELRQILNVISRIVESADEDPDKGVIQFLENIQCSLGSSRSLLTKLFEGLNSPQELYNHLGGILGLFYPLDNARYTKQMEYYRQREWRIAGRLSRLSTRVVIPAPRDLRRQLRLLDAEFFNSSRSYQGRWKVSDRCLLYPSLSDRHVMRYVRRVVCPANRVSAVTQLLLAAGFRTGVVALGSL